ncbi:hypothetical protein GCM10011583_13770 [Streptomyces camponoticapitis]|uniref:Uncharacterized protein n=1 Tax=Streptomyces camponoticapitis TaxID=1616125 RepID=A0ABQ2E003_9ACTN|nr:hypothetical protein [Streptomyces camponoticapitis]GGJ83347.1 hypothetical protein GCM10011583_13770 [Streptomyces camponoticapitis]
MPTDDSAASARTRDRETGKFQTTGPEGGRHRDDDGSGPTAAVTAGPSAVTAVAPRMERSATVRSETWAQE